MTDAVLFVLACPLPGTSRAAGTPGYLLHEVGGIPCVIGYTDRSRLVECCGAHQPWIAIGMAALMADLREQGLPGPVVNLPLGEASRWTADGPPRDLSLLAGVQASAHAGTGAAS